MTTYQCQPLAKDECLTSCGRTYTKSCDIRVRGALVVIVVGRLIVYDDGGVVAIHDFEQRRSDALYDYVSVRRKTARLCTLTAFCMGRLQVAFSIRYGLRIAFSLMPNQVST
jgi:hypothetical protein